MGLSGPGEWAEDVKGRGMSPVEVSLPRVRMGLDDPDSVLLCWHSCWPPCLLKTKHIELKLKAERGLTILDFISYLLFQTTLSTSFQLYTQNAFSPIFLSLPPLYFLPLLPFFFFRF